MTHLTPAIKTYFETMQPYDTIEVAKARNPTSLINATKEYIYAGNPDIEFNNDYTTIKKLPIWD
jgi:hypothetical protein